MSISILFVSEPAWRAHETSFLANLQEEAVADRAKRTLARDLNIVVTVCGSQRWALRSISLKMASVMMRAITVFAVLMAVSSRLRGAQLPVRLYTTDDGLASNLINRIVQDSRGFLWFCTREGISRFDGYQFTNFGRDQGLTRTKTCWRPALANTG